MASDFVWCELLFPRVYCNYEFVFSGINCVEISLAWLRMCSSKDILPLLSTVVHGYYLPETSCLLFNLDSPASASNPKSGLMWRWTLCCYYFLTRAQIKTGRLPLVVLCLWMNFPPLSTCWEHSSSECSVFLGGPFPRCFPDSQDHVSRSHLKPLRDIDLQVFLGLT